MGEGVIGGGKGNRRGRGCNRGDTGKMKEEVALRQARYRRGAEVALEAR